MRSKLLMRCLLGVAALVLSSVSELRAERRVALVIGNGAYTRAPQLANPPSDAKAIAALLRNVGFDVLEGEDLDRDRMADRLREFAAATPGADVALMYYAGHGISVEGRNYLLPVDANLRSEIDVKLGGIFDVEVMLQQTMGDAKIKLVLLDACRDNPFVSQILRSMSRTRGLAVVPGLSEMRSSEGTLIAFATGPGQVALDGDKGHSPFTRALLEHLAVPDMEIRHVLTRVRAQVSEETKKRQLPWENTNLTGFFYMNKVANAAPYATASVPTTVETPAAPAATINGVEMEFWRSVRDSNRAEELNAYLTRYPNGAFAAIARARLAALGNAREVKPPVEVPPQSVATPVASAGPATPNAAIRAAEATLATEESLDLDREARRKLQRQLTALGFNTHATNGKFTATTRKAVLDWQSARGYPASGYLNRLQHDALLAEQAPDDERNRSVRSDVRRQTAPRNRPAATPNYNPAAAAAAAAIFSGVARGVICRHGRC